MNPRAFKPKAEPSAPAVVELALPSGLDRLQEIIEVELDRTRTKQRQRGDAQAMLPEEIGALKSLGSIYIETKKAIRAEKIAERVGDELEGKTDDELREIIAKGMKK